MMDMLNNDEEVTTTDEVTTEDEAEADEMADELVEALNGGGDSEEETK